MTKASSLQQWISYGFLCVLIQGIIFYLLFHLAFGIAFAMLYAPYGIVSLLTLLMFPAMYWAVKSYIRLRDGRKRMLLVLGGYMVSTALIGVHYAGRAGLIPNEDVIPMSIIMTIGLAISLVFAYYVRKRIDS